MIPGAHDLTFGRDAEAHRAFLGDHLERPGIDAGGGWMIFGLPPAEFAVHPAEENHLHQLSFICENIGAFVRGLGERGDRTSGIHEESWGRLLREPLPGGGVIGVCEPRRQRP